MNTTTSFQCLFLIFLVFLLHVQSENERIECVEREKYALLNFKSWLMDDYGLLSSWGTKPDCCTWEGVQCDNVTNHVIALDLAATSDGYARLRGKIGPSLLELVDLNYLDLSYNDFNHTQIPNFIGSLSKLQHLNMAVSNFIGVIPYSLGNLSKLQFLDLHGNMLNSNLGSILGSLTRLSTLDLSRNKFEGIILDALGNLTHLSDLDLSDNNFRGVIPNAFGDLTNLEHLNLSYNNFEGIIPDAFGHLRNLLSLDLSNNELEGIALNSLGSLSSLSSIDISSNALKGTISEAHLFNLSNLGSLDLSSNSNLSVRINSSWNPPFQLSLLLLNHCKLGPQFPKWLRTQKQLYYLHISNSEICDTIPHWFWDNTPSNVNLSHNHIYAVLPHLMPSCQFIDLSFNELNGSLPILQDSLNINLSRNKLSGTNIEFCNFTFIYALDLSYNQLSGHISKECFAKLLSTSYLNLGNNNFSGEIVSSNNLTCKLNFLYLRNNSFTGSIPQLLNNCSSLVILDLGDNQFTGEMSMLLGENMLDLVVLSLKSNKLHGSLPSKLCRLAKVQVLDISQNKISGTIPRCVNNFTRLSVKSNLNSTSFEVWQVDNFQNSAEIMWKGKLSEYINTLRLLKAIDFSSNDLVGEIPSEISSLHGLIGLNLSKNNLGGTIPHDIDKLEFLNFLDLSNNKLSGSVPPTLSQMNHLGILDLSFNNLSGKIPWDAHMQTFTASAFIGNPELCGSPLVSKPCSRDAGMSKWPSIWAENLEHEEMLKSKGFYISMAVGFIVAFWGVSGIAFFNKKCNSVIQKMFICVGY